MNLVYTYYMNIVFSFLLSLIHCYHLYELFVELCSFQYVLKNVLLKK